MTLLEMAQIVVKVTGCSSEIVFEALPIDDPQVRKPDITRARAARLGAAGAVGRRARAAARVAWAQAGLSRTSEPTDWCRPLRRRRTAQ